MLFAASVLFTVVRYVFNEVNNRFPSLPFSLRALEDEKQVSADAAVEKVVLWLSLP